MPQLPSAADVIALTGTDFPVPFVGAIIQDAALIASDCLRGVDGDRQEAALKWLAAHLISSAGETSGTLTSDKLGDAAQTYAKTVTVTGAGLMGSAYGQQAIALLPCLSGIGMRTGKFLVL